MSRTISKDEARKLRKAFRMPAVQSMKSRKTSITNAFVSAIIPVIKPTPEEIADALEILGMTAETVTCIYCGDKSSAWDHLRPIVVGRRPTGFISEIANLVPCCQPCNSSKGNKPWRTWMAGEAPQSSASRNVPDLQSRIERLDAFERWRQPTHVDFAAIVGAQVYEDYWRELDRIIGEMEQSQRLADKLRAQIAAHGSWQPRPTGSGDSAATSTT
jgi:HNH endonuclease